MNLFTCTNLKDQYREEYHLHTHHQSKELPYLEEYFCWVNTLDLENGNKLAETVTNAKNSGKH